MSSKSPFTLPPPMDVSGEQHDTAAYDDQDDNADDEQQLDNNIHDNDNEHHHHHEPFQLQSDGGFLKDIAKLACKQIDIGTAVLPKPLFEHDVEDLHHASNTNSNNDRHDVPDHNNLNNNDQHEETRYAQVVRNDFNAVVIEHHLKWSPLVGIEPGPGPGPSSSVPAPSPLTRNNTSTMKQNNTLSRTTSNSSNRSLSQKEQKWGTYDFDAADRIVDWCLANGIRRIKGHVLVWHVTTPKVLWEWESDKVRQELKQHIMTVVGHFRDRIPIWDVVNESLDPDGNLAENVFYQKIGPNYIEDCFHWAHIADPNAILLYNDNKVEGIGTAKSDGFYNLLADLKAKNVPVHGCGLQGHFNAAGTGRNRPPCPAAVKQQIRRLGELGLSVNISELDVRVSKLTSAGGGGDPTSLRNLAQRQIYHDILVAALSEKCFDGIWVWGFSDRHTWVHNFYYDDEPCIYDENYRRKGAYYGVRDAIASLTPGNRVGGEGVLLDADIDVNGNRWGHLWMQPEPDNMDGTTDNNNHTAGGDARPDWERAETPPSVGFASSDGGGADGIFAESSDDDDDGGFASSVGDELDVDGVAQQLDEDLLV